MWQLGAAANLVAMSAYLALAFAVLAGAARTRPERANPLAWATGFVLLVTAVGHGAFAAAMLLPYVGLDLPLTSLARSVFGTGPIMVWAVAVAAAGLGYWFLRWRHPGLARGTRLYIDLKERQRQALQIHDRLVQGLVSVKLSLELGRHEEAERRLSETLAEAQGIVHGLLSAPEPLSVGPGDLRREPVGGAP